MSVRVSSMVWDSSLPPDEKFVLLALADFASDTGDRIWPSQATLGRMTSKSDRAVRTTLRKLEERGLIVRLAGHGGSSSVGWRGNAYEIDLECLESYRSASAPRRARKVEARKTKPEATDGQSGSPLPPIHENHQKDPSLSERQNLEVLAKGLRPSAPPRQRQSDRSVGFPPSHKGSSLCTRCVSASQVERD